MTQMRTSKQKENQSGVVKILTVVVIVCLGLWGCARRPASPTGSVERVKVLESRAQKLEQDNRALTQARDKARQDLASLEEENARLKKDLAFQTALAREVEKLRQQAKATAAELASRTSERDDLRQQISQRVNEREVLINRCEKMRKGIQQLISQDENTAANPGQTPSLPTAVPTVSTQS